MELDELKASWQALDRRVTEISAVNARLVNEAQTRKARWRLLPLFLNALFGLIGGGIFAGIFARFWIAHWTTTSLVVSGMLLHAMSVGVVIASVMQILIIARINYAQPVVTIQRYLALLRAWSLRSFRWTWMGMFLLWPALLIVIVQSTTNINLWINARNFVINSMICGAVGALISWGFYHWSHRPGWRIGAALDRIVTGSSLERAQAAIDEIEQFARE